MLVKFFRLLIEEKKKNLFFIIAIFFSLIFEAFLRNKKRKPKFCYFKISQVFRINILR
jgi:hypothetical protein